MKEKRYPVSWYPANEEEAVARIEAIEAEYERTGVSYNEEEFFNKLNEERTWLTNKSQEDKNMAYPIKAIPTLYGEEARRFQDMADETERKYDISPKRDIKKDPRYRAMRTILESSNIKQNIAGGSRTG